MQHGFLLARKLLARHKGENRQIIIITDGEPTAHIENGEPVFSYPPTPETSGDAARGRALHARRHHDQHVHAGALGVLMNFVNEMTQINGGRAFFASPEHLGEYILVDYVSNKRKHVN